MCYDQNARLNTLYRIYVNKCGQLPKAKLSSNLLRYQVLKAEAEAIKVELDAFRVL